jgi:YidC/Oxa1 family membrane protein insertase
MIQNDPGVIIGPISQVLGWIIDFAFNFVYPITEKNSLGISIIVLTVLMRLAMVPLALKSHKSMIAMQKLTPEMDKIKKKYGDSKDPEIQRKMNAEIQALYSKHKVNPLGGCLPMLIQMPIFFALNYLMNTSYVFIPKIKTLYGQLAEAITSVPYWTGVMMNRAPSHVPKNMTIDFSPVVDPTTGVTSYKNLEKLLNKLSSEDWSVIFNGDPLNTAVKSVNELASPETLATINNLYTQKQNIEMFLGLNLLNGAGYLWPGILIPILAALTSVLSSWLMQKMSEKNSASNPQMKMQNQIMLFAMPIMMAFFTISYPVGVGIYWITSSLFQVVQQYVLNRSSGIRLFPIKKEPR